jgi:hypothetical protein
MKSIDRSYDFLWLGLGLLPLSFVAALLPVTPHDYWWYLRLGREILQSGVVPSIETYSFTQAGQAVVNQPWLAAVILWLAYAGGGLTLTFILRMAVLGISYALLWWLVRQVGAGPRLATILTILAGLSGSNNWSFRPQLMGFLFFALTLVILWQWQKTSSRALWALPVISCLWVNMHASFLLMFILGVAALLFGHGDRKRLLAVLVASFLASLLSPYGILNWKVMLEYFDISSAQGYSAEWGPAVNRGWQMNIFFAWISLLPPIAAFSPRRLSALEWVWLIGLSWMSFSGMRYVIWGLFLLAAATGSLLAGGVGDWIDRPVTVRKPAMNYGLGALLLVLPLVAVPGIRDALGLRTPAAISPDTPVEATNWSAQHPELPGPLWSDLTFSSYLIYALPSRPVWIDTRFEKAYPAALYDRFIRISRAAPDWQALLDEEGINLLMISVESEPWLLQAVGVSQQWCEMYRDPVAAIFSRCSAPIE